MQVGTNGVYMGAVATFKCLQTVNNRDQPVSVRLWLRDEQPFDPVSRYKFTSPKYNNTLEIFDAQRSDSGTYSCVTHDGRKASQKLHVYCK